MAKPLMGPCLSSAGVLCVHLAAPGVQCNICTCPQP